METKLIVRTVLLTVTSLVASLAYPSQDSIVSQGLVDAKCWFDIGEDWPETSCWYMHVPENHEDPNRYIKFPVVHFKANSKELKEPVLHLGGGGPGNPIGFHDNNTAAYVWNWYKELSLERGRDLYVIDPRGVGMAEPRLICTEMDSYSLRALTDDTDLVLNPLYSKTLRQCRDRFVEMGVDLSQYNSLAVAKDAELLRKKLGIEKWNLYGISYGTRYALTVAREYPETISAMVLDGTVFPNIDFGVRKRVSKGAAYERLFEYCETDKACSYNYPDLEERFWELVQTLNETPIKFEADIPNRGQHQIVLKGDLLGFVIYSLLYSTEVYDYFPVIVDELENGVVDTSKELVTDWVLGLFNPYHADASSISHFCVERYPFISEPNESRQVPLNKTLSGWISDSNESAKEECEIWDVEPASELENQPVRTDIPTLFMHGALDPVLPVSDLVPQMKYFKNYAYIIFDEYAHDVVSTDPCAEETAGAFFEYHLDYNYKVSCLRQ